MVGAAVATTAVSAPFPVPPTAITFSPCWTRPPLQAMSVISTHTLIPWQNVRRMLAIAFGALVLLPFQFFTPLPGSLTSTAITWFVGLILLSTIIPFSIYTSALGRLPASVATILAMSEIAWVAIYAYLLLGERLTASQLLGAVLVVAGVFVLSWHRRRTRAREGDRGQAASSA